MRCGGKGGSERGRIGRGSGKRRTERGAEEKNEEGRNWTVRRDKRTFFTTKPVFMEPCSAGLSLCDTRTLRYIKRGEAINENARNRGIPFNLSIRTSHRQIFGYIYVCGFVYLCVCVCGVCVYQWMYMSVCIFGWI